MLTDTLEPEKQIIGEHGPVPPHFGYINPKEIILPQHFKPLDASSDGVAIVSGGLDSVTMVHFLMSQGHKPHLLSFDYGQRHRRELQYALQLAENLSLRWSLIDLTSLTELISNSALTSQDAPWEPPGVEGDMFVGKEIPVPEGHYAEDNMALTVVPNRNMTMLSIAIATAVNFKYKYVAFGAHSGDHAQYPDCREVFVENLYTTAMQANEGFIDQDFVITTPWITADKGDIAQEAYRLGVQPATTYSCYRGEPNHCGRCATCVERLEAIASVGDSEWDETCYDDTEYWVGVVAEWKATH
jgi:7-cyano-7-deazaguanine synthase